MATNPKLHESSSVRKRFCSKCGDRRAEFGPARHQRCRVHNLGELRGKKLGRPNWTAPKAKH
jgi:hypothetical protein